METGPPLPERAHAIVPLPCRVDGVEHALQGIYRAPVGGLPADMIKLLAQIDAATQTAD